MAVTYKQKFNKKYGYKINQSHSLKEISDITGYSYSGLQKIFNKGIGAYKTNPGSVRPSVKSPEQWAYGRVYSAVMGGKASKVDAKELRKMSKRNTDNIFGIDGISKADQLKLQKLYNKAFTTMPGSKKQDDIKKEIDKIRSKYLNKKQTAKKASGVYAINWKDGTTTKRNSKGKIVTKKSTARDKKLGAMQKMNDFMKAKEKARKANKASFTYNGKTYKRAKTKTGMVIYKRSR